jgi:Uma2 family endonuclease
MNLLVCDPEKVERLIAERKASGFDRYDEVWEGVYIMAPLANNEHQLLTTDVCFVLREGVDREQGLIFAGVNVSDREEGWEHNYRCPDVAVYLKGNRARDCGTHWCGGPDWGAEIMSKGDRSREKFDFYARIGTRELLILDRDPWSLELYVLKRKKLKLAGRSTVKTPKVLASTVLPLSFCLKAGTTRPLLVVSRTDIEKSWRI